MTQNVSIGRCCHGEPQGPPWAPARERYGVAIQYETDPARIAQQHGKGRASREREIIPRLQQLGNQPTPIGIHHIHPAIPRHSDIEFVGA